MMKKLALALAIGLSMPSLAMANSTVVIAADGTIQTLYPHNATVGLDMSVAGAMYDGLFHFDGEMQPQPNLATGYEVSEDGKIYTITLRTGVTFTDGTPFNAEAAKFNYETQIANNYRRASLLEEIDHMEVVSENVLRFHLKVASNTFINNLTHPSQVMVSPAAIEKLGDDIRTTPVGTGRFMLDSWVRGSKVVMVRNPNYWGEPAQVDTLEVRAVPEAGSRLAMLRSGQAHFMLSLPHTMQPAVQADRRLSVGSIPSIIGRYYKLNNQNEILAKKEVRQALNYAFNKPAYAKVVYGDSALPLQSIIPQKIENFQAQAPYNYDLEKAKALLSSAGYDKGFDVEIWAKNTTESMRSAEFMQQQLRALNINSNIRPRDLASHFASGDTINANGTPAVLFDAGWSASSGTVDWAIRPLFGSTGTSNYSSYKNTRVDELLAAGQRTLDTQEKQAIYGELQQIIWEEAPAVWATEDIQLYAQSNSLEGIELLPTGGLAIGVLKLN